MSRVCKNCSERIRLDEEDSEWVDDTGSNICMEDEEDGFLVVHIPEDD
jgi:hypothetical protein